MKQHCLALILSLTSWILPAHSQNPSNFTNCKYGLYSCDRSQLTADEQAQVAVAAHARNFTNCKYGLYSCDRSQLTTDEQAQVAVAAHARNFTNCKYGLYICDRSELTADEWAQIEVAAHAPATTTNPSAPTNAGSGLCAENGSCYGDLNANSVPKTVHVNGYYRKDGTYVRGYYRSAPGTNPPKR
jgi:hypothetical protein